MTAPADPLSPEGLEQLVEYCRQVRDAARAAEDAEPDRVGKLMFAQVSLEAIFLAAWAKTAASWREEHGGKDG